MNKYDISNLVKNTELATLATKTESKAEQDKIMKLQAFDSSYFYGNIFLVMMVLKTCLFIIQQICFDMWQLKKTRKLIILLGGNQRGYILLNLSHYTLLLCII